MSICMSCGTTHRCQDVKEMAAGWRTEQADNRLLRAQLQEQWSARNESERRTSEYKSQIQAEIDKRLQVESDHDALAEKLKEAEAALSKPENHLAAENVGYRFRVGELALRADVENARLLKIIDERDDALTKWHAHQKNVPCAGCEGGHDTFWKTVVESPQWKAWRESFPQWDVMECEACGHISQGHFQAFLGYTAARPVQGEKEAGS